MNATPTVEWSVLDDRLDASRTALVRRLVSVVGASATLDGLIIHGSHTRSRGDSSSDIDIIVVLEHPDKRQSLVETLEPAIREQEAVVASAYRGRVPWFGDLWTFYFDGDPPPSVDLGIIASPDVSTFYIEPDALLLLDRKSVLAARRAECRELRLERRLRANPNVAFEAFHSLMKTAAALSRRHLWNAIEHVGHLRMLLIAELRRQVDPPEYIHVGRPNRDVESVLSAPWQDRLARTQPAYEAISIGRAAVRSAVMLRGLLGRSHDLRHPQGLMDTACRCVLRALRTRPRGGRQAPQIERR